jgi:hypothetical protein
MLHVSVYRQSSGISVGGPTDSQLKSTTPNVVYEYIQYIQYIQYIHYIQYIQYTS